MREDWQESAGRIETPQTRGVPAPEQTPDDFDALLSEYETRKQREAQRTVQRALEIEQSRRRGVEHLSTYAIPRSREVVRRLQQAGHRVVYQELLDAYPPNLRLHVYPKAGPMDLAEPGRRTFELVWGDPQPDRLFARRWTSTGLGDMIDCGSVAAADLDELWVREQLLAFVRSSLALS